MTSMHSSATWSREQFERWLRKGKSQIVVRPPYHVLPCRCHDLNCHGWRLVPAPVPAQEKGGAA